MTFINALPHGRSMRRAANDSR